MTGCSVHEGCQLSSDVWSGRAWGDRADTKDSAWYLHHSFGTQEAALVSNIASLVSPSTCRARKMVCAGDEFPGEWDSNDVWKEGCAGEGEPTATCTTSSQASCRVHTVRLSILSHCCAYMRRDCLALLLLLQYASFALTHASTCRPSQMC